MNLQVSCSVIAVCSALLEEARLSSLLETSLICNIFHSPFLVVPRDIQLSKKYKTCSVFICSYFSASGKNWKKNKRFFWKYDVRRVKCFTKYRVIPVSMTVDTVYQYGKQCIPFIISHKEYKIISVDEWREIFRVYIEWCKHSS